MSARTVFFIGGGNMAGAIIGGLDRTKWSPVVCEVSQEQRDKVEKEHKCPTVALPNDPVIRSADVILFAVKPQSVAEVLQSLKGVDLSNKLVVSIMAGVRIETLQKGLTGKDVKYVRSMPNTPMLVGKGVTGVYAIDESSRAIVESLLGASSQIYFVDDEDSLNKVTALSGSGPAYFFTFIEALRNAGEEMGFTREMATEMAIGTALGSAFLAAESEHDVSLLRQMVTSKGGTTEKALETFKEKGFEQMVRDAVFAALARGRELSKL